MDTEFVVFCIEGLAERLGISGKEAYCLLSEKTDLLTSYIIPCTDTLHTQSKEYIIDDLIEVLAGKGVTP